MRFEMCLCHPVEAPRRFGPLCRGIQPITGLFPGPLAVCTRTHACAPIKGRRAIHRLDSANSVCSWAVFFFRPR